MTDQDRIDAALAILQAQVESVRAMAVATVGRAALVQLRMVLEREAAMIRDETLRTYRRQTATYPTSEG